MAVPVERIGAVLRPGGGIGRRAPRSSGRSADRSPECRFESCPGHNATNMKGGDTPEMAATNQIGAICTAD